MNSADVTPGKKSIKEVGVSNVDINATQEGMNVSSNFLRLSNDTVLSPMQ
jgi:hypothetical protein